MSRLRIRAFESGDVGAAADLLAARHRRHRSTLPLLSPRYEDPSVAVAEVAGAWAADDASGAVAFLGDEMVGYLLGAPKGDTWGPNVWVEAAGQAVEDAEVIRDLYACAAAGWYDAGRLAHYVVVPAQDGALVDAWFRLCFGQQHTHAIQPAREPGPSSDRVTVRRAARADIPVLARLDLALPEHQARSPVFSGGVLPTLAQAEADWEDDIDDDSFATFVAEVDGDVVGTAVGCALTKSGSHTGLARPDDAAFLSFAAVLPEARGLGAGRALGESVIGWAAEAGHACIVTDWRTPNLESSRTWTRLGFRPSFLRLHRLLGY